MQGQGAALGVLSKKESWIDKLRRAGMAKLKRVSDKQIETAVRDFQKQSEITVTRRHKRRMDSNIERIILAFICMLTNL
jgi:hypothetical protein